RVHLLAASHPLVATLSLHDALPISLLLISFARVSTSAIDWLNSFSKLFNSLCVTRSSIACSFCSIKLSCSSIVPPIFDILLMTRSEEHTSELQSRFDLVCRLLLEKK